MGLDRRSTLRTGLDNVPLITEWGAICPSSAAGLEVPLSVRDSIGSTASASKGFEELARAGCTELVACTVGEVSNAAAS